jgi:hypothetical protein
MSLQRSLQKGRNLLLRAKLEGPPHWGHWMLGSALSAEELMQAL